MKLKDLYKIKICERKEIKDFIEKWHYSHNINGLRSDYCFKLIDKNNNIIGAMIYGKMAMANCWKKYGNNENDVIELRRLCCVDDTPKNTESYFIGYTLKYLRDNTNIKTVIFYADNTFGHIGVIYKASDFEFIGQTQSGRVIMYNGKRYHDKCIRTKNNGVLKPFAKEIKQALETGNAFYQKTLKKNIYKYDLEYHRLYKYNRIKWKQEYSNLKLYNFN